MEQEVINQLLFHCSLESASTLLSTLPPSSLPSISLSAIESFANQHLLTLRDLSILSLLSKHYALTAPPSTNIFHIFRSNEKVLYWIALIQGYNLAGLSDKTKVYFHKHLMKTSTFWNYDTLELFLLSISTKDQKLKLVHNETIYQTRQCQLQYIMDFFEQNPSYLPITFNYKDILVKYICMNRQETKSDKEMLARTIHRLLSSSSNVALQTNFRYCFQFFRFPYDEATSLYKPVLSVFELIQKIPLENFSTLIDNSMLGLIWTESNYVVSIRNCVRAGLVQNTVLLIQKIKEDALKNNMIEPLILALESDIQKVFIYLKFEAHFNNSFELLETFILGAPPKQKLYDKILPRIKACLTSVPERHLEKLLILLQTIKLKYTEFCDIKELTSLLAPYSEKISQLTTKQDLAASIFKFDWINQATKSKETDLLKFRGLYNIGNSCYMNSFLQSLYMTHEFRLDILNASLKQKQQQMLLKLQKQTNTTLVNTQLIRNRLMSLFELQKLFSLLYKSQRRSVDAKSLKARLPVEFQNTHQQDAIEFGRIYLMILEQFMSLVFEGRTKITIECLECNQKRQSRDKFIDLILSCQKDEGVLLNLIKQVNHPEELENIECGNCNKRTTKSIRKHDITVLPNYCILTFNRFTYDVKEKRKTKLNFKVGLEQYISLPYLTENGSDAEESYELYSFIVHRGSSSDFGHYYTFAKQDLSETSKWLCFNDSIVTELQSLSKIAEFLEATPEDTPYVLFYQNRSHINKIKSQELYKSPFLLGQKLRDVVDKEDHNFMKALEKQKKFVLPKINYNFIDRFRKDDDEEEENGFGGSKSNNNLIL